MCWVYLATIGNLQHKKKYFLRTHSWQIIYSFQSSLVTIWQNKLGLNQHIHMGLNTFDMCLVEHTHRMMAVLLHDHGLHNFTVFFLFFMFCVCQILQWIHLWILVKKNTITCHGLQQIIDNNIFMHTVQYWQKWKAIKYHQLLNCKFQFKLMIFTNCHPILPLLPWVYFFWS